MRYKELFITIILFLVILSTHAFAQTIKVMPLGDSITRGFGSTNTNGYRGDLLGLLTTEGITIDFVGSLSDGVGFADTDHEGHGGVTADFILANVGTYLQTEFNNLGPEDTGIVLLHIGTNDISGGEAPESIKDDIISIIDAINAFNPNIYIIVSSLVPRNDGDGGVKEGNNSTLNNLIELQFINKREQGIKILYAGMHELFKCNPNWATDYLTDDVHPNDTGYNLMAKIWFNRIMNAITNTDITVTDNFDRSFLGDMWDADLQYLIQNADLVNTATTGPNGWDYLAVFKGHINSNTVSLRWSSNADVAGIEQAGLAMFLDSGSKDASGYLAYIAPSNNFINLWTITNGASDQSLGSIASQTAIPQADDVFRVDMSKNANNLTFNC